VCACALRGDSVITLARIRCDDCAHAECLNEIGVSKDALLAVDFDWAIETTTTSTSTAIASTTPSPSHAEILGVIRAAMTSSAHERRAQVCALCVRV
jgi:hypothetical protein